MDWRGYLDVDFGNVEDGQFHIDGYVYFAEDDFSDTPYRAVQFSFCYVPTERRMDEDYVARAEEQCKQYVEDVSEDRAREIIEWYLANCETI